MLEFLDASQGKKCCYFYTRLKPATYTVEDIKARLNMTMQQPHVILQQELELFTY